VAVIREPRDVVKIFAGMRGGRRHLWLGLRNLFNYLELEGFSLKYLGLLREALPSVTYGVDVKVPEEGGILRSLFLLDNGQRASLTSWRITARAKEYLAIV